MGGGGGGGGVMKKTPFWIATLEVIGVAVVTGVGVAKLLCHLSAIAKKKRLIPRVEFNKQGGITSVESFGDYVGEHFVSSRHLIPLLSKVAEAYLKGDKSSTDDSRENACMLVSGVSEEGSEEENRLYHEVLKELDACMLAYFSFHWKHASALTEQLVRTGSTLQQKLRRAVNNVTRKERHQRVLMSLSTKRKFTTLVEELKKIASSNPLVPDEGHVMVPADSSVRSPVLLLIGGGMGAGKSTVVKEILNSSFWAGVARETVVVEADAFKETDIIYQTLQSMDDVAGTSELVHQFSTDAASSLLVAALNEGRDVIFDGTMSWEPFVVQTIAMVRDIHQRRYRMGPGYREEKDGSIVERYWEPVPDDDNDTQITLNGDVSPKKNGERRPYRIEFVGVTCDAHLAVVRGMRRAILTKRGVPIKGQLRSHKLFAKSLDKYIDLVDHVRIYSTTEMYGPAQMIGYKDGAEKKLLVDLETFPATRQLAELNIDGGSVEELYRQGGSWGKNGVILRNQMWHSLVRGPDREKRQAELRATIAASAAAGTREPS
ncbi:unnamed protein product [Sphagnum compactum]